MTDREALWAAVLSATADDAPRLVYADWLDEYGHPDLAAFVRVKCDLAPYPRPGRPVGMPGTPPGDVAAGLGSVSGGRGAGQAGVTNPHSLPGQSSG